MPTPTKIPWTGSVSRRLLLQDLRKGDIPLDPTEMSPPEVYFQRPEFADFEYTRFRARLNDLRKKVTAEKNRSTFDSVALARDRLNFPKKATNHRGEPRWEGSEAERLLKKDIEDGKHKNLKPKALYESQNEYMKYSLAAFRGHIYQEVQTRKFIAQRRARAGRK